MAARPLSKLVIAAILQCCAVVLLGWSGPVSAAARVALVIGNNDYADAAARLKNAGNDAKSIADKLRQLDFKVILQINAKAETMKAALREFAAEIATAEVVVFYYAGHALQYQGNNYLVPIDAALKSANDVGLDGINLLNVLSPLYRVHTKNVIILDSCRDYPFGSGAVGITTMTEFEAPPETLIAYSTAFGSVAYDGNGANSTYTTNLLKFIGAPGDDMQTVFGKVSDAVQKETSGRSNSKPQIPWIRTSLRGLVLVAAPAAAPAAPVATGKAPEPVRTAATGMTVDTAASMERSYWESIDKTRAEEVADYLEKFPDGFYASLARRRLAELSANREKLAGNSASAQLNETRAVPSAPVPAHPAPLRTAPNPAGLQAPEVPVTPRRPTESAVSEGSAPARLPSPAPPATVAPAAPVEKDKLAKADTTTTPLPGRNRYPDNGYGEYIGPDGGRYVGEFVNGLRDGQGSEAWANGNRYEGHFAKNVPDGKGKMTFPSGDVFEGTFVAGEPSGSGTYRFAATKDVYEGEIVRGELTGRGVLRNASGDLFDGIFLRGRLNGRGTFKSKSGIVYVGEFRDDVYSGEGTLQQADGTIYRGGFVAGTPQGRGVLTFADGRSFDGEFSHGLRSARGTMQSPDGTRQAAEIVDGRIQPKP